MQTQMIHTRIDKTLKENAESIFASLGINTSDAIRLFFTQVTLKRGLPFPVKIPNKETQKAMEELRTNKKLKSYSTSEFHDLLNPNSGLTYS